MAQIREFESTTESYFILDGVSYPKVYEAMLDNGYSDTKIKLVGTNRDTTPLVFSTQYTNIRVDGDSFDTAFEAISRLNQIVFSKGGGSGTGGATNVITEDSDTVAFTGNGTAGNPLSAESVGGGNNLGLIKGNATQANAPTPYTAEDFPNGLFETYVVRTPLTMPNNWGSAVTQAELDANNVYFDVKNGSVDKVLSLKQMPSGAGVLNPIDDSQIPSSKATADFFKTSQNIVLRKGTFAEIQENIDYEADGLAIVFNEQNPNNNGIYKKISGVGCGGWEKTNFINPLHHKKVTPTTANDTESLAIGGGHTSIFQDEEGTGQGHTAFGFEAGLNIGNCWATTCVGWKAGRMLSNKSIVNSWTGLLGNTGNTLFGYNIASIANGMLDCSFFGTSAGENATTCMDNAGFGIWSLRMIEEGSENAGFGHLSLGNVVGKGSAENVDNNTDVNVNSPTYSWGHRNVGLGDKAGAFDTGGNRLRFIKKNVYVGALTRGNNFAYNENVFGYMAQGLGSNTVAIGNNQVKTTHHFGVLASFCDRRVADLPTPSRFLLGARTHILDCTHRTFDLEAIGGGSNNMPVWCDGSIWRVG